MKYLAIPQPTADWLLGRTDLLDSLKENLKGLLSLPDLRNTQITAGSFRACMSSDGNVGVLWNADYLTGTGDEMWGFIRLKNPISLFENEGIYKEVFEQCLYIINQRLQLLLLDDRCSHKSHEEGLHTCSSGRGTTARQCLIGYAESDVSVGNSRSRTIICIGPSNDLDLLLRVVREDSSRLPTLVKIANDCISISKPRPILETNIFQSFGETIGSDSKRESQFSGVTVPANQAAGKTESRAKDAYRTIDWTYAQWLAPDSPLSATQRRIVESDGIQKHPIRITGPAGSGKTLVMQLLAMRLAVISEERNKKVRVLYIVHNAAMAQTVKERFTALGAAKY